MSPWIIYPAFVLLFFSGFEASAQLSPHVRALTWDECVQLATQNNSALHSADETLESSREQTKASRSGYLPQVSGTIAYKYSNAQSTTASVPNGTGSPGTPDSSGVLVSGPRSGNSSNTWVGSVSASENIFNGLSDQAKVAQAQANEGIARAKFETSKALLSYNLKTAYAGLNFSQESLRLARDIISRRERNLKLVELRFKDGRENKGSLLLYEAYLKDAQYSELQSQNSMMTARAQLAQAMGLEDYELLEIRGPIPSQEPSRQGPDLKALAVLTPNYLQSVSQTQYSEASVTAARSGFFPTLGLTGAAQRSGEWFPQNDQWSLQVGLTIPIFNGGRDYFGTRAALDSLKSAEFSRTESARQALSTLQQTYAAYVESVKKLEVDEAYLKAASMRADIARANYSNGLTSFQDWDLAETDLINRQRGIIQSQQSRIVAEAAWEQARGKGVIP